jgi:hypothetical protein
MLIATTTNCAHVSIDDESQLTKKVQVYACLELILPTKLLRGRLRATQTGKLKSFKQQSRNQDAARRSVPTKVVKRKTLMMGRGMVQRTL